MKILTVNHTLDPVSGGGTAQRALQMSHYLQKTGIESWILTTDIGFSGCKEKEIEEVHVIFLPLLWKRFYLPKFSYRKIKELVKEFDIIHLMGHWTMINIFVYYVIRRLKKPYVICSAGALSIYGRSKFLKKLYNLVIGKRIIRNANGYIAVTKDEVPAFTDYGVKAEEVTIIPNGIAADAFSVDNDWEFRDKYSLSNFPVILFVGRLNWIKGPDLLLQAFNNVQDKLKNYHLIYAGPDDGMLATLQEMSIKLGIQEKVHFIGYIGGIIKSEAYYSCDLLVIPSRQEAMSIVILEAGITGTPVLITDQCGFNEINKIGGGLEVQSSIEGLQKGLIELLQDKSQLKIAGDKLKKYIEQNYTWDFIIKKYLEVFNQILN